MIVHESVTAFSGDCFKLEHTRSFTSLYSWRLLLMKLVLSCLKRLEASFILTRIIFF